MEASARFSKWFGWIKRGRATPPPATDARAPNGQPNEVEALRRAFREESASTAGAGEDDDALVFDTDKINHANRIEEERLDRALEPLFSVISKWDYSRTEGTLKIMIDGDKLVAFANNHKSSQAILDKHFGAMLLEPFIPKSKPDDHDGIKPTIAMNKYEIVAKNKGQAKDTLAKINTAHDRYLKNQEQAAAAVLS